ncbi:MAG: DNA-binding protein WhiA [Peptococcaceae bacterium]|jgi:DNA-binding protein WhiA|nr:DNA-binding protein WhiA [Peptococcaceae bacterium]
MSFSVSTKEELARLTDLKPCCELAELAALVRMDGMLQISVRQKYVLNVGTENASVARRIYRLAKDLLQAQAEIVVRRKLHLRKNNSYMVKISLRGIDDLRRIGLIDENMQILLGIEKHLIKHRCDQKAYLRGAFMAGGSMNSPEGAYHLEIITHHEQHAQALCRLLNRFMLGAKIRVRKHKYVVYLKGSDQIVDFLGIIGAHRALLEFESIRVVKGVRNQVNRLVNCETANLSKMVEASLRQAENIRYIEKSVGLQMLSPPIREVANLRLQYPEISMAELGHLLSPIVGKSGINHRMRKIEELAEQLKGQDGERCRMEGNTCD